MSTSLFDPLKAGALSLPNRVVMAPLTRGRAGESRVPSTLMAEYYAQRAGAGLIVSEATGISPAGYGWKNAPAMYTDAHEAGWRTVTDAVHAKGGRIVLQLWHMGRLSHSILQDGVLPVAPSAVAAAGFHRSVGRDVPYETPRAMARADIARTVDDFANAAERAVRAGFDGVEIHGANGYLVDQFLKDGSNKRTDDYGGSVENRARFLLEVVEAVAAKAGADRTGLRLSPDSVQDCTDSDFIATFTRIAELLNPAKLAYLHVKEPSRDGNGRPRIPPATRAMRDVYKGVLIVNEGYDRETGLAAIESGLADAVAYGVPFIANPDLVDRFRRNAPLNKPDPATFYSREEKGYTDYPALNAQAA